MRAATRPVRRTKSPATHDRVCRAGGKRPNDDGVPVERCDSGEPARGHRRRIPPPFQVPDVHARRLVAATPVSLLDVLQKLDGVTVGRDRPREYGDGRDIRRCCDRTAPWARSLLRCLFRPQTVTGGRATLQLKLLGNDVAGPEHGKGDARGEIRGRASW